MKTKCVQTLIGLAVLLFSIGVCFGWGNTWEEIREAADTIQSIQSDFIQEKHMKMLVQPLISTGHMIYRAPGSLRWEYKHPIENVLLMDGGKTQRFVKSEGAWIKDAGVDLQGMQVVMEQITQWFAGRFEDHPFFAATLLPGAAGSGSEVPAPRIVLKPKDEAVAGMIERVELLLSPQPGVVEAVMIYENSDSFTKLIFTEPLVNESIVPSVFQKLQ